MKRLLVPFIFVANTRERFGLALFVSAALAHALYRGFQDADTEIWWLVAMIAFSSASAFGVSYLRPMWEWLRQRSVLRPAGDGTRTVLVHTRTPSPLDNAWLVPAGIVALPAPIVLSSTVFGGFSLLSHAFGVAATAVACLSLAALEVFDSPVPEDPAQIEADLGFVHTLLLGANQLLLVTGITAGVTAALVIQRSRPVLSQEEQIWGLVGAVMLSFGAYILVMGALIKRSFELREHLNK